MISMWEILGICGFAFLLFEIFMPSMFFLNFAISAFITSIFSLFITNIYALVILFVIFSFASFVFLRPIIVKKFCKSKETGVESKYIGQVAKAEEDITSSSGTIGIYGERWDARSEFDEVIPKGSEVEIVRNSSIIMYVKKVV